MGRYLGPVEKLERREGVSLDMKGERQLLRKTALERRGPGWPGEHGRARRKAPSVYGQQLREAQKLKIAYGLRERQLHTLVERSRRQREVTAGEALLVLLERRLDNVLFRLGFATTRRQARQFVSHGHVRVNGRRLDIASARVGDGDVVSLAPESAVLPVVLAATELIGRVPPWLEVDYENLSGRVLRAPRRSEIAMPVAEQLVIERYGRR